MPTATRCFGSLLLLLLTSCGGGSSAPDPIPDPVPPTVIDVFPKNLEARTGSSIRFIAQLSKPASSYTWDFGSGATPTTATTTTEFQPLVILAAPGTYTATVIVCSTECADPFEFQYTVTPDEVTDIGPHILSVSPSGTIGARGTEVTFSVEIDGVADNFDWDFGLGAREPLQQGPTPTIYLLRTGVFEGTLTAGLSGGTADTIKFAYEIGPGAVEEPPIIESLTTSVPFICDNRSLVASASVISDFPITYSWRLDGGPSPLISTNSIARLTPQVPGGRFDGQLIASNAFGSSPPLSFEVEVVDCPELTLRMEDQIGVPQGLVKLTPIPASPDFHHVTASATAPGLLISPDRLTKATINNKFLFALPPSGTLRASAQASRFRLWGGGDVTTVEVSRDMPGEVPTWNNALTTSITKASFTLPPMLIMLQGKPAVLFMDVGSKQLRLARGKVANPLAAADWDVRTVQNNSPVESHLAICEWMGKPAILRADWSRQVELLLADSATPTSPPDWRIIQLMPGVLPATVGLMSTPAGRLSVAIDHSKSAEGPIIFQAQVADPLTGADFIPSQPFALDDPELGRVVNWQDTMVVLFRWSDAIAVPLVAQPLEAHEWSRLPDVISVGFESPVELVAGDTHLWALAIAPKNGPEPTEMVMSFTTSPQPTAASDWSPERRFRWITLGDSSVPTLIACEDRLIGCWEKHDRRWFVRALLTEPAQSSDWAQIMFPESNPAANTAGFISTMVVSNRQLWFSEAEPSNGTIKVWTADIPW